MQVLQRRVLDIVARIVAAVGARLHAVYVDHRVGARNLLKMRTQRGVIGAQITENGKALVPDTNTHGWSLSICWLERLASITRPGSAGWLARARSRMNWYSACS